jgi:hypothetical protein
LASHFGLRKPVRAGKEAGLIETAPVQLKSPDAGDCNHYGWPVATMTGDTIIVMHRRVPGHKAVGVDKLDPTRFYGIVLRSEDGDKSWSPPYDLQDCMKKSMSAFGSRLLIRTCGGSTGDLNICFAPVPGQPLHCGGCRSC